MYTTKVPQIIIVNIIILQFQNLVQLYLFPYPLVCNVLAIDKNVYWTKQIVLTREEEEIIRHDLFNHVSADISIHEAEDA